MRKYTYSLPAFVVWKSHIPVLVLLIGDLFFFGRSATNAVTAVVPSATTSFSRSNTGSCTSFISGSRNVVPHYDDCLRVQLKLSRSGVGDYRPSDPRSRTWSRYPSYDGYSFLIGTRGRRNDRMNKLQMSSSSPPSRTTIGTDSNNNNHTNSTYPTTVTITSVTRSKQDKFLPLSVRRRLEKEQQEQQQLQSESQSSTSKYDTNKIFVKKDSNTVAVETSLRRQQQQDEDDENDKKTEELHFISFKQEQPNVEQDDAVTEVPMNQESIKGKDNNEADVDDNQSNELLDETTQYLLLEIIQTEYESKLQNVQNEMEVEVGLLKANHTIQLQELQTQLRKTQSEYEKKIQTLEEKSNRELNYQQFVIKTNEFIANQDKQRMEYEYEQMELAYQRQITHQISNWITAEHRSGLFSQKVKEQTKFIASLRKENSSIPSMVRKLLSLLTQRVKSKDCHKLKKGKK